MVKMVSSPSFSPVTITVSSRGKGGGSRSMGLTSPVPRASVSHNPNSPLDGRADRGSSGRRRASTGGSYGSMSKEGPMEEINSEYVSYTVHIPPTPDRRTISNSKTSLPEETKNAGKT
ncbi:hypothetical protein L6164_034737 [Bauhinia variegata]|uniref:Uncharacterized protein n=1 Tax=Bauhinia variegata TaxID=167791 RepID=A0ACB9KVJ1_BAUVA|nr:hypothetical protein L6164_034737 [Bauhinia variegata]